MTFNLNRTGLFVPSTEMAANQKGAKEEKNYNSFGNLSTLLCYSSKPSSNIVKSAEKILRAHIPKQAAIPHIDCIRNPLKLWTDKTMHGLVWIRTIEPAQWHFISVHLMESAIKVNESNAKKWHYFYRCNFFFSLLLSLLAMEACRQNDMSSKLLFLFSIRLIYFMNFSSMFFSILFAIVFGLYLFNIERVWMERWNGYWFSSTTLISMRAGLFIYFWYFRFGIHYCL